jgi:hypothetical protein
MGCSTRPHRFYCGVDLHTRAMPVCGLDHVGWVVCAPTLALLSELGGKSAAAEPFRQALPAILVLAPGTFS